MLRVCAAERAKQWPDELYSDSDVLFCKFCQHSLDHVRVDTIKDHMISKKHQANKAAQTQKPALKQVTLHSMLDSKSRSLREDFVLDFIKMLTVADIPMEKAEKMKPFIVKHCKQGGTLPKSQTLRQLYVPRLFEEHKQALKNQLVGKPVCIVADETTDIRDHSILNVVAGVGGHYYLIDVIKMDACNHATLSQSVIQV